MKQKIIMNIIPSFKANDKVCDIITNTSPPFQFISSMWLSKSLLVQ